MGMSSFFFYDIIILWRDKNSMKKLMKLMCVFALVFVAGCGASSSTDEQKEVVTNFFDYVKECDITKLKKVAKMFYQKWILKKWKKN